LSDQQEVKEPEFGHSSNDPLLEIHDPEVDPQALMDEIRQRIENRRAELGYEERTFPSFGDAVPFPDPPDDLPYSADLYHHLRQANMLYEEVETEPILAHSAALRMPALGGLWKLIRQQTHSLVLYYVNRSLAHQVTVDRHLISVLNQLVVENEELKRTLTALKDQIEKQDRQDKEA
jgi:hypothetical protein